jgi:NNP family nitrate/nitrite transporter-like MFS transporter
VTTTTGTGDGLSPALEYSRHGRTGRWIDDWRPEEPGFWAATGSAVARRNLSFSIFSEHIGFSVWTMWSALVLFLGPKYGIDPAGKFVLTSVPALAG